MTIRATGGKLHWNYFLALEHDLDLISRYIEFTKPNFSTYSIELAHLLFAAASEVDVVAKLLCALVAPTSARENINNYREALLPAINDLPETQVYVPRYGLSFSPWELWAKGENPEWWRSYNKVKHERDAHFHEATLQNTLNAVGALLIITHHYYSCALGQEPLGRLDRKETSRALEPSSSLIRLGDHYYYDNLIV